MNKHTTLEPFGSDDKVLLWFRHISGGLISYHKFKAPFSAKKFVTQVMDPDWRRGRKQSEEWKDDHTLVLDNWIIIQSDPGSSHKLKRIMAHDYTPAEEQYQLDPIWNGFANSVACYQWGSHPDVGTRSRAAQGLPALTDELLPQKSLPPTKPPPEPKIKRTPTVPQRKQRAGITLQSVCSQLQIEPKEARAALRDAKIPKPEDGWVWPDQSSVPDIKSLVEKRRKKK